MSHVATVKVWRCGYWRWPADGRSCSGNEHGCNHPECRDTCRAVESRPPTECLTHAEFMRDYGRCPSGAHGCRVAEQITLEVR